MLYQTFNSIKNLLDMKNIKDKKVYAFVDANNLNLGIKSLGWNLEYKSKMKKHR